MNKPPNSQLELIKKAFEIDDWDFLLSSSDRHIEILSKAQPPMLRIKRWYEGGSPDWVLTENLLSGHRMQDIWPNPTAFEIEISERLNALIYEYLELGGWCYQHDLWLSRYEDFVNAVRSNKLNHSER